MTTFDSVRLTNAPLLNLLNKRIRAGHAVFMEFAAQMTRHEILIVPTRAVEYMGATPFGNPRVILAIEGKGCLRLPYPPGQINKGYLQGKMDFPNNPDAANVTCVLNAVLATDVMAYLASVPLCGDHVDHNHPDNQWI